MNHSIVPKLIKPLGDKAPASYTLAFLLKKRDKKTRQKVLKTFLDTTR